MKNYFNVFELFILNNSQAFDTLVPSSGEELNKYYLKIQNYQISNNVSKYPSKFFSK
jgi:hypothetical protein